MKDTIVHLIVTAALSFSGAALAAGEMASQAQPAPAQPTQPVAAASAVPATVTESTSAAPAKKTQPAAKRTTSGKHAKAPHPKNLDLRYCLELETNVAIAKCAGEY
jgi:hypothetical protein